jgi:hypothetical protein
MVRWLLALTVSMTLPSVAGATSAFAMLARAAGGLSDAIVAGQTADATSDAAAPAVPAEDTIAALEKDDPGSPDALDARIEYAQSLVGATDGDCQQRVDSAQSQLDTVARDPSFDVVLPNGRARLTDVQYHIYLARASCGPERSERETLLGAALAAAQQAVELYRDALDYQSMVVMQYNVGVTQRMLGDDAGAIASLEVAVSMDREYGFRQDAEENYKLLDLWKGSAGDTLDFPTRTTTLKFGWLASDANLGIEIDHATVSDGDVKHGRAYRLFKQHVHAGHDGWVVSYEPGQVEYDVAWPSESFELSDLAYSFGRALPIPGFEINSKGDFKRVIDLYGVSSDESAAVRALILGHTQPEGGKPRLRSQDVRATRAQFAPGAVEQNTAEDYDFQTGVWIGATLEQGVWYNMSVPLTLPGARQVMISSEVEFAYTRDVPCTADSPSRSCVEIVVHATPAAEDLATLLGYFNRELGGHPAVKAHFWCTTYIRIVTDPNTLTPYVYEERRYWHVSGSKMGTDESHNKADKIVSTFTYH